ncbi:MAG: hypothetical protein FIB07_13275 [Candidatus Methanoperedens sp.]|nr:hypothetical protein [Candidatus Methanoperedens sp.]
MTLYYDKICGLCEKYLSGGGKMFLDRQISAHLNKNPELLEPTDKTDLAKWCKISGKLILGEDKSQKLANEILSS